MHPAFYRKILTLVDLDQDDFEILNRLICTSATYKRRRDIARVGEQPSFLCIVLEGWAARYSLRTDGSRRITGILMPGDFCGIHAVSAAVMDHAITALTTCKIGKIELRELENALRSVPKLGQALWRSKLIEESLLRMWLLNSKDAAKSLAHLLCELHTRASQLGLTQGAACEIPLTQEDLGDALGLTAVHVNRMLRELREQGLVEFSNMRLTIPDVPALHAASGFDPQYLYLNIPRYSE
jgi:CRP-like cAMP-binding protein